MAPSNVLQTHGNEKTMNLNHMIISNITASPYFKVKCFELKTYHEVVDEIYFKVEHLEPWEKGSRKTAGQTGMCGGVRGVGAGGIISSCFCLLYKLFTLKLTRKQLIGLLEHNDSPYIRGLGFLYIRFALPPSDFWEWFEPYLDDPEEIDVKAGGGHAITIGQLCHQFITKLEWYATLFPRIPVPIQKEQELKLKQWKLENGHIEENTRREEYGQFSEYERTENRDRNDCESRNDNGKDNDKGHSNGQHDRYEDRRSDKFSDRQEERKEDCRKGDFRKEEYRREDHRGDLRKDGNRRDDRRRDDHRRNDYRRDETRRDETRRDETRRDETRRDETRRDETRRDETRRDEARRDERRDRRDDSYRRDERRSRKEGSHKYDDRRKEHGSREKRSNRESSFDRDLRKARRRVERSRSR